MPYDRAISTAGFQPLTTASSTENIGMGHLASDLAIAIGIESLGATLQGEMGAFGGKPLIARLTGNFLFTGRYNKETDAFKSGSEVLRRKAASSHRALFSPNETFEQVFEGQNFKDMKDKALLKRFAEMRQEAEIVDPTSGKKVHGRGVRQQVKSMDRMLGSIGIGRSLKFLSRAWVFNDISSMAMAAGAGVSQGFASFAYERGGSAYNPAATNMQDLGTGFAETRSSFTQRQRAMQAIHNSQMNTRAAMGNEATFMHV